MAYTANIPKVDRYRTESVNRTNDRVRPKPYHVDGARIPETLSARKQPLSCDAVFYTIEQVTELTGWSVKTIQKLFNAPDFPSTDLGRHKLVEAHALIEYFSVKRERIDADDWK